MTEEETAAMILKRTEEGPGNGVVHYRINSHDEKLLEQLQETKNVRKIKP